MTRRTSCDVIEQRKSETMGRGGPHRGGGAGAADGIEGRQTWTRNTSQCIQKTGKTFSFQLAANSKYDPIKEQRRGKLCILVRKVHTQILRRGA